MPGGIIPIATTEVIWDFGEVIIPAGYTAVCKKWDMQADNHNSVVDPPLLTIYGELTIYDHLDLEAENVSGGVRTTTIRIMPGGVLNLVGSIIHWQGDATADNSRLIDVQGTFNITPRFDLDDESAITLKIGNQGVVNLLYNNGSSGFDDILTKGSDGIEDFAPGARINFASTTGDQNFDNSEVWPNVGVTGGRTLYLTTPLSSANLKGDLIAENGIMDLGNHLVTGNQINKVVVDSAGVLRIGGTKTFPVSTGGAGQFTTPNLKKWSTVEYDGEGIQNIGGQNYWNLTLSDDNLGANGYKYTNGQSYVSGILSVEDYVTLDVLNDYLTLVSTGDLADETGMIGPVTGTITGGKIIAQRDMDLTAEPNNRFGWNDWCSPIVSCNIKSWADCCVRTTGFTGSNQPSLSFNSVLYYDAEIITDSKNQGWTGATNIYNQIGTGNAVRLWDGNFDNTLADTGDVHVGDFVRNLDFKDIGNDYEEGWNLMGNPYACPINFTQLYATGITGSVYNAMWMYSNETGYYTYNGVLGIGSGIYIVDATPLSSSLIPAHHGFWLKAQETGVSVTFKESHKNTSGVTFMKDGAPKVEYVRVQIESEINGYKKAAVLALKSDALLTQDIYDAEYLAHPLPDAPALAFTEPNGMNLTIHTIPSSPEFKEIKMYVKVNVAGDYSIRFFDLEKMNMQRCIVLIDNETNQKYNIRDTPLLTFNLDENTATDRFKLVMGSPLDAEKLKDITCFGYNDGQVGVSWEGDNSSAYDLYRNDTLLYQDFQQSLFIKDLKPGTFKIIPKDTASYCNGAKFEVEIIEPKVVISQIAAPSDWETEIPLTFYNTSAGGSSFWWDFDDGNFSTEMVPKHTYINTGSFMVKLIVNNQSIACADTSYHEITIIEKTDSETDINYQVKKAEHLYRIVRGNDFYELNWLNVNAQKIHLQIVGINGQLLEDYSVNALQGTNLRINTSNWSQGVYILKLLDSNQLYTEKLLR